ncbi:flagellar basal-body rod protein FlgC [Candidatus Kryptonium thompsonii]|uniref:Flagellar basal-body rod protein FlgC n=1 Tax=Candidatus Kryptonium thompsonii TaxID=1633631 RepID=A0A0P1LDC8_9BACT|nr:flagellar basal body rod protein FlgC [Candidatus Kryptonium thompsoni]CUS77127.1 flagellar basal-body rod protein FlgC [Candidatus Kryptonium thompsoni]CUS79210.1 flagellar basal-body rod protein FlgC [Candidatus Kryptonium thompsoni]CUS79718.1 flagellar basal-body rod protein FlgC [Candidatus Kryptonium thompsoni]CUS82565.1 flagellar basal-body rod protein FlgC [Candidatus Kryptonium thompsoni]CUS92832.1 flagellar basal-body rod protein FlgC [Candidatus Kryptonium thompsoni]
MKLERLFASFNISAMGLSAQRKRMTAIAENIANVETTRTEKGTPYKRKVVVMRASVEGNFANVLKKETMGLEVTNEKHISSNFVEFEDGRDAVRGVRTEVVEDNSPERLVYNPEHPDADENGYVHMPNVNIVVEMVDMISATRSYEANVTAFNASKNMAKDALEI